MPLASGTRLGPYEILAPLGAGGMGEVYRARDPRLNRDVALKILSGGTVADAEIQRRFDQEACSTACSAKPPLPGRQGSCRPLCGSGSQRIDSLTIARCGLASANRQ
jgi:serine/threonine protein kinase